jgi:hypothetical protein
MEYVGMTGGGVLKAGTGLVGVSQIPICAVIGRAIALIVRCGCEFALLNVRFRRHDAFLETAMDK